MNANNPIKKLTEKVKTFYRGLPVHNTEALDIVTLKQTGSNAERDAAVAQKNIYIMRRGVLAYETASMIGYPSSMSVAIGQNYRSLTNPEISAVEVYNGITNDELPQSAVDSSKPLRAYLPNLRKRISINDAFSIESIVRGSDDNLERTDLPVYITREINARHQGK
jgi:hypothetical protein